MDFPFICVDFCVLVGVSFWHSAAANRNFNPQEMAKAEL
jgi:hypothetical protein